MHRDYLLANENFFWGDFFLKKGSYKKWLFFIKVYALQKCGMTQNLYTIIVILSFLVVFLH